MDDHARALYQIALKGMPGQTYAIGGNCEKTNLEIVQAICDQMQMKSDDDFLYSSLIRHISDRPGHDYRYAIDTSKIKNELGWEPEELFKTGLAKTIDWYLTNKEWCSEAIIQT